MYQEHMNRYFEVIDTAGNSFIKWARPEGWIDAPTVNWPLVNFKEATTIAFGYLAFVFIATIIMQFLPAIPGLYPFKFVYNLIQVMLCSYMCIEAAIRAYSAGYTLLPCNAFNQANPPIAFILYVFYLSKMLDFLDTVFIILEKRWNQLSFLHVYHHFSIFLSYWINMNIGYDGDVYITIVLNGFIHTIMYSYYFVSLHTKDIWWKQFLTASQIIQFMIMNSQAIYLLMTGCKTYPLRLLYVYFWYVVSLLVLFLNYFIVSYIFKRGKKSNKDKSHKEE